RPGHTLAGHPAAPACASPRVLHPDDLRGEPGPAEGAQNAAVMAEVAVIIGGPLPDADGGQMRRLERRDLPLVHRVVGDAVQADLDGAPRLRHRPLDYMAAVRRLSCGTTCGVAATCACYT